MEGTIEQQPSTVEISSFGTRAVNALASPGELFREVAAAPVQNSSWLVPYLIGVVLLALMVYSFTSNPVIYDQLREAQRVELEKKVAAGDMTREQAGAAMSFMENKGLFLALGIAGGIVAVSAVVFCAPLVYWVASKIVLKFTGGYKKVLEVYGLATIVGIVGMLVMMIMMNAMDSMHAKPSGGFFLRDVYDQDNFWHNAAASMNVFSIWQVAVTGIGLSSISGKSRGAGMALSFGLWLVYVVIASFLGWGDR